MPNPLRAVYSLDNSNSWASKMRSRRMDELIRRFPDLRNERVVDLGGSIDFWESAPARPERVYVVNLEPATKVVHWAEAIEMDACEWSRSVTPEATLVFSNSLLEHVGGYARRRELATAIRDSSLPYWVQTPYRYFPIEPHWVMPLQQFLPLSARTWAARHWRYGNITTTSKEEALEECLNIELISRTEMRHLFPDATIWEERLVGLTKSIVAISS